MQTLINGLNKIFEPFDKDNLERSYEWAEATRVRLLEFKRSDEGKALRADQWAYYKKLFDICGGKTWWKVMDNAPAQRVRDFVLKNHEATISKRNAKIASKLEKANIKEVLDANYFYTSDGFDGIFNVVTEQGNKIVKINSIIAGGYNIQCVHMRVLVSVK